MTPSTEASAPSVSADPSAAVPTRGRRRQWLLAQAGGLALAVLGLGFSLWFLHLNPMLPHLFRMLFEPWHAAGHNFDWSGLLWGAGALAVFTVIGRLYLEGLELYLPRGAGLALAFLFGLGLCGFVFESLAIPYLLNRTLIGGCLAGLLVLLVLRAWRRVRELPESRLGGDAGPAEQQMRRALARQAWALSVEHPRTAAARALRLLTLALLGLITFVNFWHALLYPEVYWDSLILYLGYARMTFLEGGFPIKVVGQVGIGLGANYPHLFEVLGAAISTAAGAWSELPQRLLTPLAGLATTVLVYQTALRLTRHVNAALLFALLYRALPLGLYYDQNASNYALVLLFGAGFLYLALLYIETGLFGAFAAATVLIALALHLNYLMGILAAPWVVMLLAAHVARGRAGSPVRLPAEAAEAPWVALARRKPLGAFLLERRTLLLLAGAAALGSTWFIRNWIVTGNPVYAFFYKQLGGLNINPEVMRGAELEWAANGWGIGRLDEHFPSRLRAAWYYFVMAPQSYQTAPLMMGFALGGVLAWAAQLLGGWRRRGCDAFRAGGEPRAGGELRAGLSRDALRYGAVVLTLFAALIVFHFTIAPFYLYQIVKILPCLAILACFAWPWWRVQPWRVVFALLVLWCGLVPGLAMALMGWKVVRPIELAGGRVEGQGSLFALRHPLPDQATFYRWQYGPDAVMWDYINQHLKGQRLLTHDNRHLAYDPTITIRHLDDWDVQALWDVRDPAARVRRLVRELGIEYYLYIPNEDATPTNKRLGAAEWPKLGLAQLIYEAGPNRLYHLTPR